MKDTCRTFYCLLSQRGILLCRGLILGRYNRANLAEPHVLIKLADIRGQKFFFPIREVVEWLEKKNLIAAQFNYDELDRLAEEFEIILWQVSEDQSRENGAVIIPPVASTPYRDIAAKNPQKRRRPQSKEGKAEVSDFMEKTAKQVTDQPQEEASRLRPPELARDFWLKRRAKDATFVAKKITRGGKLAVPLTFQRTFRDEGPTLSNPSQDVQFVRQKDLPSFRGRSIKYYQPTSRVRPLKRINAASNTNARMHSHQQLAEKGGSHKVDSNALVEQRPTAQVESAMQQSAEIPTLANKCASIWDKDADDLIQTFIRRGPGDEWVKVLRIWNADEFAGLNRQVPVQPLGKAQAYHAEQIVYRITLDARVSMYPQTQATVLPRKQIVLGDICLDEVPAPLEVINDKPRGVRTNSIEPQQKRERAQISAPREDPPNHALGLDVVEAVHKIRGVKCIGSTKPGQLPAADLQSEQDNADPCDTGGGQDATEYFEPAEATVRHLLMQSSQLAAHITHQHIEQTVPSTEIVAAAAPSSAAPNEDATLKTHAGQGDTRLGACGASQAHDTSVVAAVPANQQQGSVSNYEASSDAQHSREKALDRAPTVQQARAGTPLPEDPRAIQAEAAPSPRQDMQAPPQDMHVTQPDAHPGHDRPHMPPLHHINPQPSSYEKSQPENIPRNASPYAFQAYPTHLAVQAPYSPYHPRLAHQQQPAASPPPHHRAATSPQQVAWQQALQGMGPAVWQHTPEVAPALSSLDVAISCLQAFRDMRTLVPPVQRPGLNERAHRRHRRILGNLQQVLDDLIEEEGDMSELAPAFASTVRGVRLALEQAAACMYAASFTAAPQYQVDTQYATMQQQPPQQHLHIPQQATGYEQQATQARQVQVAHEGMYAQPLVQPSGQGQLQQAQQWGMLRQNAPAAQMLALEQRVAHGSGAHQQLRIMEPQSGTMQVAHAQFGMEQPQGNDAKPLQPHDAATVQVMRTAVPGTQVQHGLGHGNGGQQRPDLHHTMDRARTLQQHTSGHASAADGQHAQEKATGIRNPSGVSQIEHPPQTQFTTRTEDVNQDPVVQQLKQAASRQELDAPQSNWHSQPQGFSTHVAPSREHRSAVPVGITIGQRGANFAGMPQSSRNFKGGPVPNNAVLGQAEQGKAQVRAAANAPRGKLTSSVYGASVQASQAKHAAKRQQSQGLKRKAGTAHHQVAASGPEPQLDFIVIRGSKKQAKPDGMALEIPGGHLPVEQQPALNIPKPHTSPYQTDPTRPHATEGQKPPPVKPPQTAGATAAQRWTSRPHGNLEEHPKHLQPLGGAPYPTAKPPLDNQARGAPTSSPQLHALPNQQSASGQQLINSQPPAAALQGIPSSGLQASVHPIALPPPKVAASALGQALPANGRTGGEAGNMGTPLESCIVQLSQEPTLPYSLPPDVPTFVTGAENAVPNHNIMGPNQGLLPKNSTHATNQQLGGTQFALQLGKGSAASNVQISTVMQSPPKHKICHSQGQQQSAPTTHQQA